MSLILRTLRKNKFIRELQPVWVAHDDIQADALKDLETSDNDLSVWLVADDLSNLNRVLAAVAANRDQLANIDFALISEEALSQLGILLRKTPSVTPDHEVSLLHRDISQLTARQVASLAHAISKDAQLDRRSKSQIQAMLLVSITTNYIDRASLKPDVANKFL